jgi:hypothetical protein
VFFGKPFPAIFNMARERIRPGVPDERVLMVGDTLHTDILGGTGRRVQDRADRRVMAFSAARIRPRAIARIRNRAGFHSRSAMSTADIPSSH